MEPSGRVAADVLWCSASDLAEYTFCPRAYWYRHHPPDGPVDPAAERSRSDGRTYHASYALAVETRERQATAWAVAIVVAAVVLLVALVVGAGLG